MKIRQILFYYFLLVLISSCLSSKTETEPAVIDASTFEEYQKNLSILNDTSGKTPGIVYQIYEGIDTTALMNELQSKAISTERRRKLYQTVKLKQRIKNEPFIKVPEKLPKDTSLKSFHFSNDSLVIIKDGQRIKLWSLINLKKDSIYTHWEKDNKLFYRKRTFTLASIPNDSIITFIIDTFKNDRKLILGFDCFKISVTTKNKKHPRMDEVASIFEIYVTDEIKGLPPKYMYAGNFAFFKILPELDFCALEITEHFLSLPHAYQVISASKIIQSDSTIFEVPNHYKKAVRYYHTLHDDFLSPESSQYLDSIECHGVY